MSDEASRGLQLLEEGSRILHAAWDDAVSMVGDSEHASRHSPRATLGYPRVLLDDGVPFELTTNERTERAARAIAAVLALQETRPGNAHEGNFRWALEEETVRDLNGVEFMLDALIPIACDHEARLPAATNEAMRAAIALGLEEIDRLDVHASYTNIYLSDVCNSVLGGELLGDAEYVERGLRRLDEWFAFTHRSGAPHEYNSPTYMAVDIARMAALAEHTQDREIALKARVAEELLWLHVATHYHPLLGHLAGPHARSYFDGWTGAGGYLKLMLWKLLGDDVLRRETPYARHGREEGHVGVGYEVAHCPMYIRDLLREKAYPFESRETPDATGLDIATYMTADYALGTTSRTYAVGVPPEPSLQPSAMLLFFRRDVAPGYGSLTSRYIINEKRAGAAIGSEIVDDLWDEGRGIATQHRNRAIVAYGLLPRDAAIRSAKLSLRLLGIGDATEVWVGDRRVDAYPASVAPGEPVMIAEGGAYIALVPLEPTDMGSDAPLELRRDGHLLTLDIYNYLGPQKVFWEYRTLGGAFYQGNVRNAAIVEVAARGEYENVAAFRAHIAAARITDSVDEDLEREISYASEGGSVSLGYSLRDMRTIERKHDGERYTPPMSRSGGIDAGPHPAGAQIVASADGIVRAGGATLIAGTTPKWLIADAGAGRYIYINPTDDPAPLLLETATASVECDAIGFSRVEVSGADVRVETQDTFAPVLVRGDGLRLFVNGTDVTDDMTATGDDLREFRGVGGG